MKVTCIYHGDSDGIVSAMVVKKAYMEKDAATVFDFHSFSYDAKFNPEWLKTDKLYLVDASYDADTMKSIVDVLGSNFVWIDHHATAIKKVNLVNASFEGIRSIESAGCMLCWKFFYGVFNKAPLLVDQIDKFDRWVHTDVWESLTQPLNLFIQTYWTQPEDINPIFVTDDNFIQESATTLGSAIYLFLKTQEKHAMLKSVIADVEIEGHTYSILAVNTSLHSSELFTPYCEERNLHPDIYMRYTLSGSSASISLYAPEGKDIDVGFICSQISASGGGHRAAAGATLPITSFMKTFANLFK